MERGPILSSNLLGIGLLVRFTLRTIRALSGNPKIRSILLWPTLLGRGGRIEGGFGPVFG